MGKYLTIFICIVIFLSSCTFLQRVKDSVRTPPEDTASQTEKSDREVKKRISTLITQKDFEGALEIIRSEIKRGRPEQAFASLHVESENGLLNQGIEFFRSEEYLSAGMVFRKAFSHMPPDGKVNENIIMSSENVSAYIERCSDILMEQGLMEYRQGNLDKALSIWEGILQFNPANERAKKAIDTARVQKKNLKKMESN